MKILKIKKTNNRTRYYVCGIKVLSLRRTSDLALREIYDEEFYKAQAENSYKSAQQVLPYVRSLLKPKSVLDVGCGVGTWLKVWSELGAEIQGIDSNQIPEKSLYVPRSRIQICDLSSISMSAVNKTTDRFDLVETLEVAEHLEEHVADGFVDFLCSKADAVLFSAAIPHQGGTHHVNLQPIDYWNKKFQSRGYDCFDIIREKYWEDNNIDVWYRQNMVLFAKGKSKENLISQGFNPSEKVNTYYHPEIIGWFVQKK